jgi:hypothetical protein
MLKKCALISSLFFFSCGEEIVENNDGDIFPGTDPFTIMHLQNCAENLNCKLLDMNLKAYPLNALDLYIIKKATKEQGVEKGKNKILECIKQNIAKLNKLKRTLEQDDLEKKEIKEEQEQNN